MKSILMVLTFGFLLAMNGCAVFGSSRPHREPDDGAMTGVDHGEHPGDLEHGDTMQ